MKEKKYFSFDKNLNLKPSVAPKPRPVIKKSKMDLANSMNIGYYLLTPLLIGVFFGLYLDGRLGTNYLVVIGILIGSIGSIYNLFKLIKQ
jgi:F0F1-type ATP synthase assembly protein I